VFEARDASGVFLYGESSGFGGRKQIVVGEEDALHGVIDEVSACGVGRKMVGGVCFD
jgi:hypothetical protein